MYQNILRLKDTRLSINLFLYHYLVGLFYGSLVKRPCMPSLFLSNHFKENLVSLWRENNWNGETPIFNLLDKKITLIDCPEFFCSHKVGATDVSKYLTKRDSFLAFPETALNISVLTMFLMLGFWLLVNSDCATEVGKLARCR